jgi:hypothetical protein
MTRVCEESKTMMNKIMMEDKIGGYSKLSFWKPIIQGYEYIKLSTPLGMHLYILFVSLS